MNYLIVSYDISDNKRRKRVSDILEGYGIRVNRSLFECLVKNARILEVLKEELIQEIDLQNDSVRFYFINSKDKEKSFALTNEADPFERDAIYYF